MKRNNKSLALLNAVLLIIFIAKSFAAEMPEDYGFSPEYANLYKAYLEDPKEFEQQIKTDQETFYKTYEDDRLEKNTFWVIYYSIHNKDGMQTSIHQMRYETLVYAYIFAKEQHKEKAFFRNAFPRESHCVPSQITPVQSWLMAEKEALLVSPSEVAERKLTINIRDLFQTNAFLGARIHNIILYWFAPRCIDFFQQQYPDMKPMTLNEYELNPEMLKTYFCELPDTNAIIDELAEQFATDVYNHLSEEAKKRFIELWNTPDEKKNPADMYHLYRDSCALYSEDSYTQVNLSVTDEAKSKVMITELDVDVIEIMQAAPRDNTNIHIAMTAVPAEVSISGKH